MKNSALILLLLLLSMAYGVMNSQGYSTGVENHFPISVTSPQTNRNGLPFAGERNNFPPLRAGDKNDIGDGLINTGGNDANGNQNDIPTGDGILFLIILTWCYVYNQKFRSTSENGRKKLK